MRMVALRTVVWTVVVGQLAIFAAAAPPDADGERTGSSNAAKQAAAAGDQARREYASPEVDPNLPNVLLIGDSISIGYTLAVRDELRGEANVFRPATNCGPTTNGLQSLGQWLGQRQWDVIHFNFGLHDMKYMGPGGEDRVDPESAGSYQQVPIEQYAANLHILVARLKRTGATLIWRETTPVPQGARGRVPGDAARYNAAAAKVIAEHKGIAIDPMHVYASRPPIRELQRPANVHYTAAGSRQLAEHVAAAIRSALAD